MIEDIKELGSIYNPSGQDIIKYRLWKEQQGICLYTGAPLEIERLFEPGYSEIDHIIPYSISFNDSYKNKVLVTAKANREKGNKLPLQYVQSRDDFIGLTNTLIHDKAKRNNLLKEQIAPEDESALKDRSLQDTQFISRFMLNYIRDHLLFNNEVEKKIRVRAVNGRITAYLHKRWGLNKIRGNGDLHHAMDAVVVGCVTQGAINYLTSYSKYKELEWYIPTEDTEKRHFPTPWPEFKREVDFRFSTNPVQLLFDSPLRNYADVNIAAIKPFFVSRRVRKKTTGQAHKETIRAYREYDGIMQTVTKTSIKNLKYDAVNDEIIGYYNPSSDRLLYELLKERLRQFGGDAQKAFPEGFVHKPTPKGCVNTDSPPIVKKVKILDKSTLNVEVNDGVAGNGDMVRIDIFHVENEGYYFVPIYVSDMVKPVLPNRASVSGKPYSEWKEMREEDFIFSLYPNDLVKITAKKGMKFARVFDDATIAKDYIANEILLYYKNADIATASIRLITHDNSYFLRGCGIKTLVLLEKYYVDVLGNVYKAPKEKRGR